MSDRDGNGQLDAEPDGEEESKHLVRAASTSTSQSRWNAGAVPMERSAKFGESVRRLFQVLGRERAKLALVAFCAVTSVGLNVIGPRILGHATDLIISGTTGGGGIDFGALHRTLSVAIVLYGCSAGLQICSAWIVTGLVQRTMLHLRQLAEAKIHALPLSLSLIHI